MTYDFILDFNNCITPSIVVYYKEEGSVKASKMNVALDENGRLNDLDQVSKLIKDYLKTEGKSCLMLLNLKEAFTINRLYPNLNLRKSKRLFDSSVKEDFPNINSYKLYECEYDADGCSVYNIYALEFETLDYYKHFLEKCGFKTIAYKVKGQYLIDEYIDRYKIDNFALYYYENDLLFFNVCLKGKLLYSITCPDTRESANHMALSCIDGFNYKLKKNVINTIVTNRDEESICDYEVDVGKIGKNFSQEGERF